MPRPLCNRSADTAIHLEGPVGEYIAAVTQQWLLIAPQANPAMLEMFRDRDAAPLRDMVAWAGEFAGKYLTAAVQVLRTGGDDKLHAYLEDFVARLVTFQAEDGYLGPWPADHRLTGTAPNVMRKGATWDAWGHYHIMLGLILWHEQTGDKPALAAATRIADLLCRKFLGRNKPRLVDTGNTDKNLSPVHTLAILYRKKKNPRYLRLARQIVDEFAAENRDGPLAGDYLRCALAGKAFYETPRPRWESLHAIMGMAELYWITGDEQYRTAYEQLWWSIVELDRHNNGGFTSGEKAKGNPYDRGAIETCCTIAWIAMSVEMLKLTKDSIVADEIELSTLNSVMGMHSPAGRWATYNTPMSGVRKASAHEIVFQAREGSAELNCCSVNAPRGFGMISDWALMKDRQGLILNYYGPSQLSAKVRGGVTVTLTQKTRYPATGRVNLTVSASKAADFTLKLRIPHWSAATRVKINGQAERSIEPGRYLAVKRTWKRNDHVQIDLDMSLHFWVGERELENQTSVYRGPILLTYDHRYNLEHAAKHRGKNRKPRPQPAEQSAEPPPREDQLSIAPIDARYLQPKPARWHDWLAPQLLMECTDTSGRTIRLCDFASAGEGGTPYVSWLPIRNAPQTSFTRRRPLRSAQLNR